MSALQVNITDVVLVAAPAPARPRRAPVRWRRPASIDASWCCAPFTRCDPCRAGPGGA